MYLTNTTKECANLNYLKNRGEPGQWFQHKADYVEDKPVPRIRVGGFEVVEKAKPTIGDIIVPNKFDLIKPNDIHVRLTTIESKKIADKFNFQEDKWFDFAGNLSYKPPKAPKKLYTKTAEEIAENNWQQRSHDWFNHNRPKSSADVVNVDKCIETDAIVNSIKIRSSHADQWFKTWSNKDKKESSTAPNSPKTRVKYEGVDNALRARGVGAELLMHSNQFDQNYDDSALPYRCVSEAAGNNCRNQTYGSDMAKCLGKSSGNSSRNEKPQDRVTNEEAREYLDRNRSGTMNLTVDGTSVSIKPKVRPEAEEYYFKARGNVGSIIDQNVNKGYSSPQPVARIRSEEARQAFETNKGIMGTVVGRTSYRAPVYKSKNHPRGNIGSDAQENLQKNAGSSMKQLVENYKLAPDDPPKKRGWEESSLRRTSSVGNLFINYGKKTAPVVPPLRLYGNAFEVADKYRAQDFYKTIQQQPPSK